MNIIYKLLAVTLLITSTVGAIPPAPCDPQPCNVCCEDPKPGPFAFSYPQELTLSCPQDFYIWGEFLYMQAKEDGLDYGITAGNDNAEYFPVTSSKVLGFSNDHHDWDYNPGLRVGFGFIFASFLLFQLYQFPAIPMSISSA